MVGRHDLATGADRDGVAEATVVASVDEPHERGAGAGVGGDLVERCEVLRHEGALEDEVLGRVAGDGQLRQRDQVAPGRGGPADRVDDLLGVADEVADDEVELGGGESQHGHARTLRAGPSGPAGPPALACPRRRRRYGAADAPGAGPRDRRRPHRRGRPVRGASCARTARGTSAGDHRARPRGERRAGGGRRGQPGAAAPRRERPPVRSACSRRSTAPPTCRSPRRRRCAGGRTSNCSGSPLATCAGSTTSPPPRAGCPTSPAP